MSPHRLIRLLSLLPLLCSLGLSSQWAAAEAREQKVKISAIDQAGSCRVTAVFEGDHDNCTLDDAHGRSNCSRGQGCVCTRQEKHITWEMQGRESFEIRFDQGSQNPFVQDGSNECNFKSNKKGKLRCRVKGKDTPKGDYRYSIHVPHCEPFRTHLTLY